MGFFESLLGGVGDTIAGVQAQNRANEYDSMRSTADLDYKDYENIDYMGDFNPEKYTSPEEAQYSLAQDSAEGRAAQLAALQDMRELTDQSAGSTSALGRQRAEMDARQLAQSREGAIRQDAMRRGQVGGAADMIARQQAAQAAANQNLSGGLQSAQMAALQQLAGTQAGSQMAGQLRGQDQAMAFNNADTINKFNMFNTGARNDVSQANTDMKNAAGMRNISTMQGLAGQNTAINNNTADRNNANRMADLIAEREKKKLKLGEREKGSALASSSLSKTGAAGDSLMSMASGGMG